MSSWDCLVTCDRCPVGFRRSHPKITQGAGGARAGGEVQQGLQNGCKTGRPVEMATELSVGAVGFYVFRLRACPDCRVPSQHPVEAGARERECSEHKPAQAPLLLRPPPPGRTPGNVAGRHLGARVMTEKELT